MRHTARIGRLQRELAPGPGAPDAPARQAWLREQRLPAGGDRVAAVIAIYEQAAVPSDSYRDPACRDAVSALFAQLSLDELRELADGAQSGGSDGASASA